MRLVQHGTGGLVVAFLVGSDDWPALAAALPGVAIVATDQAPLQPTLRVLDDARALAHVTEDVPLCLVGFSAGCQSVRALLLLKAPAAAVVCIDGTHASVPPAAWQLGVWRSFGDRARRSEVLFVGTCTSMGYTERIPPGQKGRATSTRHVLEQAFGVELADFAPHVEGHLVLQRWPSSDCDHAAHVHQQNEVMPEMLRRYVAPFLAGVGSGPDTDPTPLTVLPWLDAALPLGVRCVMWSQAEMAAGVREDPPGSNRGPRIDAYLDPTEPIYRRASGERLRLRGVAWCAAAAGAAHRACARPGEAYPTVRVSGIEMYQDASEVGAWVSAAEVRAGAYVPQVGDIFIFSRGAPGSWERHVARLCSAWAQAFETIGGNEGPGEWRETMHRATDADWLGVIRVDRSRGGGA